MAKEVTRSLEIENLRVLIFGVGSIGERHIRNLWHLGVSDITAYRTRNLPFRDVGGASVAVVTDLSGVAVGDFHLAIICTPTHLHMQQALWCVERGIHTLVEKPIAHNLTDVPALKKAIAKRPVVLSVAYMMRYHPLLLHMKELISTKALGALVYIESEWREYLPDWHPWEDYRESYAAKKEMGGGAALTLSHDLDLLCWLLDDKPKNWEVKRYVTPTIATTADTIADFLFQFEKGTPARVHLNMAAPIPQRKTVVIFEKGTVSFDYFANKLEIQKKDEDSKEYHLASFERNQMYVDELRDFLENVVANKTENSFAAIDHAAFLTKLAIS